mmetsp:Transcript_10257/g.16743  ORF Transcript_10257/g.16743 Transcript_10257/m.16743 type:complete len:490 (-) Transcript_10257:27-1496(-)
MKTTRDLPCMVRAPFAACRNIICVLVVSCCLDVVDATYLRKNRAEQREERDYAYDYSKHGQDWNFGSCASRARQSPIDLPFSAGVVDPFHYHYNLITEPFELLNNGKVFLADLADKGYGGVTYENAYYDLRSIEVHSLSEHWWGNRQRPVELQLIHKRSDGDATLIVSVGVDQPIMANPYPYLLQLNATSKEAKHHQMPTAPVPSNVAYVEPPPYEPNFNPTLQAFLTEQLPPINMKLRVRADSAHSYDLNTFLTGGTFFDYGGSFTEPPCGETVTWLVRNEPIPASLTQMMYLQQAVGLTTNGNGNYRSLMPLNGRMIRQRAAVLGEPALVIPVEVPLPPVNPVNDRLVQAARMSMDAMKYAQAATYMMRDLDARMHDAAQAHASALAPRLEPLIVHGSVVLPAEGNSTGAGVAKQSEDFANRTAAIHYSQTRLGPEAMQDTAIKMSRILSDATRQVVEEATEEIAQDSKKAAKEAAREAAEQILVAR